MLDHIPGFLSISLDSRIAGLSYRSFLANFIHNHRLTPRSSMWTDGTGRMFVWADELAQALERKITLAEVQAADQKLQRKRDYMKRYRRNKTEKR
jgi:hypothetical protein